LVGVGKPGAMQASERRHGTLHVHHPAIVYVMHVCGCQRSIASDARRRAFEADIKETQDSFQQTSSAYHATLPSQLRPFAIAIYQRER